MLSALINGILLGFALAFLIGPAFFSLIQTSIKHGFRVGVSFAFGVFLSDLTWILLTYFGVSSFVSDSNSRVILITITGGIVIIILGVITILKSNKIKVNYDETDLPQISGKHYYLYILKGFTLNILNPSVVIYWLMLTSVASTHYSDSKINTFIFLMSIPLTVLITDIVKSFLANKLKNKLTDKNIILVNRIVGGVLIVFGVYLIVSKILNICLVW